jgi:hypothetical protein
MFSGETGWNGWVRGFTPGLRKHSRSSSAVNYLMWWIAVLLLLACDDKPAQPVQAISHGPDRTAEPPKDTLGATETTIEVTVLGKRGFLAVPNSSVSNRWRADPAMLERFERGFPEGLEDEARKAAKLNDFIRQYRGMITTDGEKVLAVSFFCEKPEGIERGPVVRFDWLGCQGSVEYLPDRHVYRNLIANVP